MMGWVYRCDEVESGEGVQKIRGGLWTGFTDEVLRKAKMVGTKNVI